MLLSSHSDAAVVDYPWSLTDINAELPEELGNLLGSDNTSLGSGTTVSAQNGIGGVSGGDILQQTQMLDVSGAQNHQQLSQLLAGNSIAMASPSSSSYGASSIVTLSRHATVGVASATSAAAAAPTNIANPRGAAIPGIVTTLGQVTNNIVTLSRQGNITLVPAGTQGVNTVIGGHRVQAPSQQQQQQQLVAINAGVANAGATLLSVSSPNATMARLQPMSSTNIGAVMSLTAAGMVINVSQSQPGLPVSANGTHIGPTLVMQRGVTPQRFSNATVQQQNVIDGSSGNVGLCNPAQMTMPTVARQQMGARVCQCFVIFHLFAKKLPVAGYTNKRRKYLYWVLQPMAGLQRPQYSIIDL